MNAPTRLAVFAAGLVVTFAVSAWAGSAVGPGADPAPPSHSNQSHSNQSHPNQSHSIQSHGSEKR